jgi:hypothetical protein
MNLLPSRTENTHTGVIVTHTFACGAKQQYILPESKPAFDVAFNRHRQECKHCHSRAFFRPVVIDSFVSMTTGNFSDSIREMSFEQAELDSNERKVYASYTGAF